MTTPPAAASPVWPFGSLVPMKYGVILADPPWAYAMRSEKGHAKSPDAHYATMSLDAIKALPVADLAGRDCYLFMWSTWPHLDQAIEVMKAWGFQYVTGGSWLKRTVNWKVSFGTGFVLRSATEPYLVGRFGPSETASNSIRNVLIAPEISLQPQDIADSIEAIRREHSRKPDEMRAMIEKLFKRHYYFCELFARAPWPGNDVWGNQSDKFAEADQ